MKKILIDGGPCAGKTTGIKIVSQTLREIGYFPVIVPEAAGILKVGGLNIDNFGRNDFQRAIISLQLSNEKIFAKLGQQIELKSSKHCVLLYDRGTLSSAAWLEHEDPLLVYEDIVLKPLGTTVEECRKNYDYVVHMVTVANGCEELYTRENKVLGTIRTSDVQQAKILDERIYKLYDKHSNVVKITNIDDTGNQISYQEKVRILTEVILSQLTQRKDQQQ